jgi:hypothetical protein
MKLAGIKKVPNKIINHCGVSYFPHVDMSFTIRLAYIFLSRLCVEYNQANLIFVRIVIFVI